MTITTEQFVDVNTGSVANDGTGDSLRTAFIKVNKNFANISSIGFDSGDINCQGNIEVSGYATINGNLIVSGQYVPTANNSLGTAGQITWSSGNVYICVAANTWVRASLTSAF
jgi:hypothetical protein